MKYKIDLAFPVNLDSLSYVLYLLSRIHTTGTKKEKNKVKEETVEIERIL